MTPIALSCLCTGGFLSTGIDVNGFRLMKIFSITSGGMRQSGQIVRGPAEMKKRPPLHSLSTHPYAYVSPPELADYLACDPRTLLRMIENGSIKAYRVGRNWRITIEEARRVFPVERASQYTA